VDVAKQILMRLSKHPAAEWRHKVFVCYVAVMLLVFLLPVPTTPVAESRHVDKLAHFGIFLGFALLCHIDRQWKAWWTFLISVAFAGGIELVQSILPYREGDWLDLVAGAAGGALGVVLGLLIEQRHPQVRRSLDG